MTEQPIITTSVVRQEGSNVYYRVFVDGVEKPSLIFVRAADRTVHGDAALKEWCKRSLHKLESGKVVEANLSAGE